MKTNKIKADCLVAFIHSRLIGLGMDKNEGNIQLAFEDKNISEKLDIMVIILRKN